MSDTILRHLPPKVRAFCLHCDTNDWTFVIGGLYTEFGNKELWQCHNCKRVVCTNDEEMFEQDYI